MAENGTVRIPISPTDLQSYSIFACDPPELLYHYTDLNGANGIITSKSLRLTKIKYLNDTSELNYGIGLFRSVAGNISNRIDNSEKREFLKATAEQLSSFSQTNICIASFCENGDLLSQWRAYGGLGCGVALGFSGEGVRKILTSGLMNLWKCIYEPRFHYKIINDLIEILLLSYDVIERNRVSTENWEKTKKDLIGYFNTTFLRVVPIIKNAHFQEEKEWRIITVPLKYTDKDYYALVSNDRVSQYYVLNFPTSNGGNYDILDNIVIGPSKEPDLIAEALSVLLSHNDYRVKYIQCSQIPYRVK